MLQGDGIRGGCPKIYLQQFNGMRTKQQNELVTPSRQKVLR